jgi:hypothetical protein
VLGFPPTEQAGLALTRMTGGRDLALAALTLVARDDRPALRTVALTAAWVDAIDAVSLGLAGRHREMRPAGIGGVLAGGSAAIAGAWAGRKLNA